MSNSKKTLNIILGVNNTYMLPAFTTIQSVLNHLPHDVMAHFFILHCGLSNTFMNVTHNALSTEKSSIHFINCSEDIEELKKSFSYASIHWSQETYLPLLIPTLFKNFDKTIFLDADLLIRTDISAMTDFLSENDKIAAIPSMDRRINKIIDVGNYDYCLYLSRDILQLKKPENYFNSGVIVFNHKAITEEDAQKCLELTQKKWEFCDEPILNKVFEDHLHILPLEWNYDCAHYERSSKVYPEEYKEEWINAKSNPFIFHYTGLNKPWLKKNLPFAAEYNATWNQVIHKIQDNLYSIFPHCKEIS